MSVSELVQPCAAEALFGEDVRAGRTGMITRWADLTPAQRAGYRYAARLPGQTYSLALAAVVPVATLPAR